MNGIPYTGYQVFRQGKGAYRFMQYYPLPKQQLQLLYPGRLMSNQWHYNGDNIPNEDPQGLIYTQSHTSALERAAAIEEEALARHLGGKYNVARHPFVAPESTIEDPDLRYVSIRDSPDPNLQKVPSHIPSMKTIDTAGERLSKTSEAESHRAEQVARLGEETGLPDRVIREAGFEYHPGAPQGIPRRVREGFCMDQTPNVHPFSPAKKTHGAHPPEFVTPRHGPPFWRESFGHSEESFGHSQEWDKDIHDIEKDLEKHEYGTKEPLWMWIVLGVVILLVLIVIGVIIYEAVKRSRKK